MTHPIYVVEQAVKSFISQWFNGLEPKLQLCTDADGKISVSCEVSCFSAISGNEEHVVGVYSSSSEQCPDQNLLYPQITTDLILKSSSTQTEEAKMELSTAKIL